MVWETVWYSKDSEYTSLLEFIGIKPLIVGT